MTGVLLKFALLSVLALGILGWLFPAWRVRIRRGVKQLALGLLVGSAAYILWALRPL